MIRIVNKSTARSIIVLLTCVLIFCTCRYKKEPLSALDLTGYELRRVFAEYDCERYEVDVAVYRLPKETISIDVYYNEAYSLQKIRDLLDLKEAAEKYNSYRSRGQIYVFSEDTNNNSDSN